LGISPIEKTDNLLHDNDEYLDQAVFEKGIVWMQKIVEALGNLDF
jgi:hypothetical protein